MSQDRPDPPEKKVDNDEIRSVFDQRGDLSVVEGSPTCGKWELSSREVADLVNDRLGLGEDGISRQAIHRRLERMSDVIKVKHGRTVAWRLESDVLHLNGNNSSRPKIDLRKQIIATLEKTDHRAMTLGMITEEVDGARATINDRLDRLVDNGVVESDKIGNATAYYISGPESASDVGQDSMCEKIIQTLRNNDRPFMGTGELAAELGYSSNAGVTQHLNRASSESLIKKANISGYNVWYLPDLS